MKKLYAGLVCICLALTTAGCGAAPSVSRPASTDFAANIVESSPTEPYHSDQLQQPMHAIVMPTIQDHVKADDGTVVFQRSYQRIQLILNGTDADETIAADLKTRMDSVLADTSDLEADAQDHYSQEPEYWTPHFIDISYTPTRIDQSILSLFGNYSSYAGGAHPFLSTESVTYDLATGKSLKLSEALVDNYSNSDLCALVTAALAPVSDELYFDYEECLQDIFSVNLSNIRNWYFSSSGLVFHFAPYEIAPYSSGTIIAAIPYENLSGILREQYLPASEPAASGSMYAEMYLDDDAERFTFLAEVELAPDGTPVLLHPDATVTNLRIESGTWSYDGSRYIPVSTVFAADSLGLSNGIVLTADLTDEENILRLVYSSGGQEVSAILQYDEAGDAIVLAHG